MASQNNKIYSTKSFWKFRKLGTAITLNPPEHVDWEDIVRDKIMPCLKNPISGVTGTPEEKKAFFEYIKDGSRRTKCVASRRMRKTEAFELLYTFDVSTQIIRGKKQICMEVRGGTDQKLVPIDYSKDDKFKQYAGKYVRVYYGMKGKTEYRFREKEIMTKSFKEIYDGEILNEENVWNAYTDLCTKLYNVMTFSLFAEICSRSPSPDCSSGCALVGVASFPGLS